MKKNKIFGIENCFKHLEYKDDYIDLQKIEIYDKHKTAILITDKNNDLTGSNFYDNVLNNNLNVLSYFSKNLKKDPNSTYWDIEFNNKVNKFDDVAFFNMAERVEQFSQYPLVFKADELEENYTKSKERIDELNKTMSKYLFPIRHLILNLLAEEADSLLVIYQDYERNFNSILNKVKNNASQKVFSKLQEDLEELEYYQDLFLEEQLSITLKLWDEIFNKFLFFYNASKSNIDYLGDEQIINLKRRLDYLIKMRKTSKKSVEDTLIIRDIKNDILALDEMVKELSYNSEQKIKYFAFRYKISAEIDLSKANYFTRESSQVQILNKRYYVKMFAYKLLKRYKKCFKYLKAEEIDELQKTLDTTIKLFISNSLGNITYGAKNFSIKKIKKILKNEFYFNVDSYKMRSKNNFNTIKELKDEYQKYIAIIKNRIHGHYFNTVPERSIKNTKEKLINAQSEHNWKLNKIQNEYYAALKSNEKLLNSYDSMSLISQNVMKKNKKIKNNLKFKRVFDRSISDNDISRIKNFELGLKKLMDKFNLFDFVFKNLIELKKIIGSNKKISSKLLNQFDRLNRLIEIFEKSSISAKSLIKPYEHISKINKLKMNFISSIIKKPTLIFIADDPNIKDQKLKFEFLRSAFELCKESEINVVFVTQDKNIVENSEFDYVYLVANNKEVEFGNLSEVLGNTINPEAKSRINDQEISQEIIRNQREFVFSDIYDVDEEHYIITPPKYFKLWMQGHKNENKSLLVSDEQSQEKTIETQINDLKNPLLEKTVLIASLDPKEVKKSKHLDQTFTQELKIIQATFGDNESTNSRSSIDIDSLDDLF
ncbi:hypothetical protein NPA07_04525 [Mycoplasmopsis caviae]|uniref:Uncharacterized protein n=1 Tax=Mycoplasmopsis caviae TaxID=55603 RepID=A0A3P8LI97_9BACT|nr:hypothetical protein [Mycoplasmopsis caviae]UUD35042.1 hypothetical protein NPA07_04525 [Mycoplasmopsis caviae]VDR42132.1 Uncharacterised protein [Mycoplasmopsis caviae]